MQRTHSLLLIFLLLNLFFIREAGAQNPSSTIDIDVTYISRSPAYDYDGSQGWPNENEIVTFTAHIKNRGTASTGNFSYTWKIDNNVLASDTSNSISPGQSLTLSTQWRWQHQVINNAVQGSHTIEFIADPNNSILEVSKTNNSVKDFTQALGIGFWVEQAVYDYFNQNQFSYCQDKSCVGSNSWEDWAQRQVKLFNSLLASAKSSRFPQGAIDRVRLEKVTVVSNCTIPNDNRPATDKSVDFIWGFTSAKVEPIPGCIRDENDGNKRLYKNNPQFLNLEYPLIHELSHARYIIDLYMFNIQAKEVLLQENGVPIAGTPLMPIIGGTTIYLNKEQKIMGGGLYEDGYDPHSVGALNRIAGRRARGGNYNAPSVYGEYLYDLPQKINFQFFTSKGQPVPYASLKMFRGKEVVPLYRYYQEPPDVEGSTNQIGIFSYVGNIFGTPLVSWGMLKNVLIYRLQIQDIVSYGFQEITDVNLAYWSRQTQEVTIPIVTRISDLPPGPTPTSSPSIPTLKRGWNNTLWQNFSATLLPTTCPLFTSKFRERWNTNYIGYYLQPGNSINTSKIYIFCK